MPVCYKCDKLQATAELRKTSKGYICKDKVPCRRRAKEAVNG